MLRAARDVRRHAQPPRPPLPRRRRGGAPVPRRELRRGDVPPRRPPLPRIASAASRSRPRARGGGRLPASRTSSVTRIAECAAFITEVERRRDPSHVRAYSHREWVAFLRAAGLTVIDEKVLEKSRPWDDWTARMRMTPRRPRRAGALRPRRARALPRGLRLPGRRTGASRPSPTGCCCSAPIATSPRCADPRVSSPRRAKILPSALSPHSPVRNSGRPRDARIPAALRGRSPRPRARPRRWQVHCVRSKSGRAPPRSRAP